MKNFSSGARVVLKSQYGYEVLVLCDHFITVIIVTDREGGHYGKGSLSGCSLS